MAETLIKIYKGPEFENPVSEGNDENPAFAGIIKVPEEGYEKGDWIPLALKCNDGYETREYEDRHARLSVVDTGESNESYWRLAPDDGENNPDEENASDWGEHLDFTEKIDNTLTKFWAQARANESEIPINDRDINLQVTATIGATN